MFSFGRGKPSSLYGVIIDVGSGSVGVGIIESDHTKKLPEIIFSHRVFMRVNKRKTDQTERLRQMREALFSASLILSKEGLQALTDHDKHGRIGRILVTCSSPWAHTVSRNVSFEQDKDTKITEKLIEELVETAESEISEELKETEIVGSLGLKIVERATVNVRVNGYTVHNPTELVGKTIDLSHITGLIPEEVLESIYEVQDKILTNTEISAHTYMLVVYCVLRDLFPHTNSFCIVDVTGESTEFGIVENGILIRTIHAPYGSNTMLRDISEKSGKTPDEVTTMLRSYTENTSNESKRSEIESYLSVYESVISETLTAIHNHNHIPRTMIITALPQLEDLFKNRIPKIAEEISGEPFSSLVIQRKILDEIAGKNNSDTFITLASRFFHKLHGCGEIDSP